MFMGIKEFFI